MRKIVEQGKAAGWTQQQYREECRNFLSEMRQQLRLGNMALNKNYRPWAAKF